MGKCSVDGCQASIHAAGLCRTHYGRKWRGKPMEGRTESRRNEIECADDRRLSLERELTEAKRIYSMSVGVQARVKWSGRMRELQGLLSQ
jgi:hypothetical protein